VQKSLWFRGSDPFQVYMSQPPAIVLTDTSSPAYKKAQRQHLKSISKRNNDIELTWTPFRAAEKKYKARFPPPDLSHVLDLATLDDARVDEVVHGRWCGGTHAVDHKEIQLNTQSHQKAFVVPRIPGTACTYDNDRYIYFGINNAGLVVLPSFVSHQDQKRLVRWALCDQARNNETNLDAHYILPEEGLWNTFIKSRKGLSEDVVIQPIALLCPEQAVPEVPGPRKLIANTPASPETFSSLSASPKSPPTPSPTVPPFSCSALVPKLRWANIGWSYHWGAKQYNFTKGKGTVSPVIRNVCKSAVELVDWRAVFGDSSEDDAEWGHGDGWHTWTETYGSTSYFLIRDHNLITLMKNLMQGLSTSIKQRSNPCCTASVDRADGQVLGFSNGAR
jgi:alkylated DNA repair protein alkB family protein 1